MSDEERTIGIGVYIWVNTEMDAANIIEKLARPLTGFILEGHHVHLGRMDTDDDNN